ncbi:MAG: glutamate cyclase domain-containing protein [Pseudomonadota bacterium]
MTLDDLGTAIEALLVKKNLRHMEDLRSSLPSGYYLRAARHLHGAHRIIIGTGFPVGETFETDGPVGAFALYNALTARGAQCHLACAAPLADTLGNDFQLLRLSAFDVQSGKEEAAASLATLRPDCIVSIERPGLAEDGRYYNMRGEDISARSAVFDYYLTLADCPTVAIGDGGNEIGMGNAKDAVAELAIRGSATPCDELLIADVSNWGAYGLIAILDAMDRTELLNDVDHLALLTYLSERDSVDGVTRENTLTEDGLPATAGQAILDELKAMVVRFRSSDEQG